MMNLARPGEAAQPTRYRSVDGILLLDKPVGLTSNRALQLARHLYGARKGGHTGSLDPLASGMLPICFGQATKISAFLLDADKTYLVTVALGIGTTTGDAEGAISATGPADLTDEQLERAMASCRGPIMQVPPMYSALKHRGQRLYALARAGMEVDRPPRPVRIEELMLVDRSPAGPVLRVRCSKGTYVRTLVEDIARNAGTVAHVAALRRLSLGPFRAGAMYSLEALHEAARVGPAALDGLLLPSDAAIPDWPAVLLDDEQASRICHGQEANLREAQCPAPGGGIRLYDARGAFLGVGKCLGGGRIAPSRLMVTAWSPGPDPEIGL